MKLKKHVKMVLHINPFIFIEKHPGTEKVNRFEAQCKQVYLGTKDMGNEPCFHPDCDNICRDYCWNCERPLCRDHSYRVVFALTGLIFNVCKECAVAIEDSDILEVLD